MGFTGPYKNLQECTYCHTPRGNHSYFTLPLAEQIRGLHAGAGEARDAMNYTKETLETYQPGVYRDIHDGEAVRRLLGQKVIVNGAEQDHCYFEDPRDIPLGMMTDGFQCFKRVHRGKASAWPVIFINYGRSSLTRMRIYNIIPYTIIPGPNSPKDFNSFLYPLKDELDELAVGVDMYDGGADKVFKQHAYLIVAIGDMPAVKHFSYMKGPGSKSACRGCGIHGIYHRPRKKYYIPLRPPDDYPEPINRLNYQDHDLPLRTTAQLKEQIRDLQNARTATQRTELAKEYGVCGRSILLTFPGFDPTLGYPHECMHLLFENIVPMMIYLWKGKFRDVDTAGEPFVLSIGQWEEIGRLTVESNPTIPSLFSRPIHNVYVDQHLFTAESYAFWFIYMAPTLLCNRFQDDQYYTHMLLLVRIMKTLLLYEITEEQIVDLDEDIGRWVSEFERYAKFYPGYLALITKLCSLYYQYRTDLLPLCTLPVHALLHVPADIRASGPISNCWSWVMERFCGVIGTYAQAGRRYPYKTLSNRILNHALIQYFDNRWDLGIRTLFEQHRRNEHDDEDEEYEPGRIEGSEWSNLVTLLVIIDPTLADLLMSAPERRRTELDDTIRRRIAKYFPVLIGGGLSIRDFEQHLPHTAQKWRKLQITGGGDTIRGVEDATASISRTEGRDNSFVRVSTQSHSLCTAD